MSEVGAMYASPGLRWGLLLEDYPGASYRFDYRSGEAAAELNVPSQYGGTGAFCVATITFPKRERDEHQREPVVGFKACKANGTPDEWGVLCTKTLGRALKRAGYPDDLTDLKALVHWRERNAQVNAVATGMQPFGVLTAAPVERALEEAAREQGDVGRDDAVDTGSGGDEDATDPMERPPSDEARDQMKAAIAKLKAKDSRVLNAWTREQGWSLGRPATQGQALAIRDFALNLAEQVEKPPDPSGPPPPRKRDDLVVLLEGLNNEDLAALEAHMRDVGIDTKEYDPRTWTDEQADMVLVWFGELEESAAPAEEVDAVDVEVVESDGATWAEEAAKVARETGEVPDFVAAARG